MNEHISIRYGSRRFLPTSKLTCCFGTSEQLSSRYGLMYPLSKVNLNDYEPDSFINPLWDTEAKMAMKIYLSTKSDYDGTFLRSEFEPRDDIVLLWEQRIDTTPSLSKTFLISSLDCIRNGKTNECDADDSSLEFAREWLDTQDKALLEDDGSILSTIQSAAGQGIESTSILLTVGQGISNKLNSVLESLGIVEDTSKNEEDISDRGVLPRSDVHLPAS